MICIFIDLHSLQREQTQCLGVDITEAYQFILTGTIPMPNFNYKFQEALPS